MSEVPKNYYFIEGIVTPKIIRWQELRAIDQSEITESDFALRTKLLDEVMREIDKVARAVIFRSQLHKKEQFDICHEIAIEACVKAIPRFNPEFGTAFNYFSLTTKKSIMYYLIKKRKKKTLSLDYEYDEENNLSLQNLLSQDEKILKNLEIENLVDSIYNLLDNSPENRTIIKVVDRFKDYLLYTQGKYDKRDFFNFSKADGISSNLLRKFLKVLKDNKESLYSCTGVY